MGEVSVSSGKLRITLRKSLIGEKPKTRATAESLGLRRIGQSVERPADDTTRGMVRKIAHLVETVELGGDR